MPVKVMFAPQAREEMRAAYQWYGAGGVGSRFAKDVAEAVRKICEHPKRWPVIRGEVRRCQTNKFPYGVLYKIKSDHVRVLAVMHLHRNPSYWINRDDRP